MGDSNTLEDIMFDRGWSRETLNEELRKRRVVLAYLIDRGLNSYAQVAATFQAFINDPETVLALMANEELERSLEDLREMESVLINVDRDKEEMVPRPEPDEAGREEVERILDEAENLFAEYRGRLPDSVADALLEVAPAVDVEASPDADHEALTETAREAAALHPDAAGPERPDAGADENDIGEDDAADSDADVAAESPDSAPSSSEPVRHDSFEGVADATPVDSEPEVATDRTTSADDSVDANGSAATNDPSPDDGAIDFDEPFDEGIDVLDPADEEADAPAAASAEGGDGETGDVSGGVEADDNASSDKEDDDAETDDEDDDAETDDEDDAEADEDIGDWGFGTVESPEEG
jgi:flagellar protein FlaI